MFRLSKQLLSQQILCLLLNQKKNSNENYRSVSILPNVPKIYERCLFSQISNHFEVFSKYHCGFRQDLSARYCRIFVTEKWKKYADNSKTFRAFNQPVKSFWHDHIIAKLNSCGSSFSSLRLIHSYISNQKQRRKTNSAYSSWQKILYTAPTRFHSQTTFV